MKRPIAQRGFPNGQAPKKRKQKDTPSRRTREARQLVQRIEAASHQRHEAWAEGDHPNVVHQRTTELDVLHGDKREMRRDIYARAPQLEGRPVFKGQPGGRS
jgi:hypothetical protein